MVESVRALPTSFQVPLRTTMPDHTHATLGGQGETRSCEAKVPSADRVSCRSYLRASHEGLDHAPSGPEVAGGADALALAGALAALEGSCVGGAAAVAEGVGVAVTVTSLEGAGAVADEDEAPVLHATSAKDESVRKAVRFTWRDTLARALSQACPRSGSLRSPRGSPL